MGPFLIRAIHGFARNSSRKQGAAVVERRLEAMRIRGPVHDLAFEGFVPVFDAQTLDTVASARYSSAVQLEVAATLNQSQARALVVEQFEKFLQRSQLTVMNG